MKNRRRGNRKKDRAGLPPHKWREERKERAKQVEKEILWYEKYQTEQVQRMYSGYTTKTLCRTLMSLVTQGKHRNDQGFDAQSIREELDYREREAQKREDLANRKHSSRGSWSFRGKRYCPWCGTRIRAWPGREKRMHKGLEFCTIACHNEYVGRRNLDLMSRVK